MRRILLLAIVLIAVSIPGGVSAQPAISSEIAPLGKLRVAMNAGNPVLIKRAPDGKIIGGVGLAVGKFMAEKLDVPFELVPYPDSNTYTESIGKGEWDIGIGPPIPLAVEKATLARICCWLTTCILPRPGSSLPMPFKLTGPESR